MKKIVVSIVGLSMVVMMVPGIAQGLTAEELQAQIATLTAQLATLQAQLTALTGTPAAAACTFARALYPGVSGADVQCLQQYLNGAGFALAASGVGSAGNETQYFGSLTQAAVKKWQDANGVVYGAYGGYFGPVSQAKYVALGGAVTPVTPVTPTGGAEGGIFATINSSPASGAEVYVGTTGKAVAAVDVKAIGDIVVNRLDLNFSKRPWLYVTSVTVTDGTTSKTVSVTQAGTSEVTVGSSYLFRIDGLNISIPKDTTKTLTVTVDAVSALPGTETSTDVALTFAADCIRATDGVGLSQYAPTAALAARTITMKEGDTAALEVTANVDNPEDRPVIVSDTATTAGVVLLKADVKAKNKDAILRTVEVTDDASGTISVLYLYDGDTLLSSTSSLGIAGSSTLADINLTIPKDTTKTLTVKADLYKTDGKYAEGATTTMILNAGKDGFAAEDATTFAAATVTGSDVTSGTAYLYTKAPSLTLASTEINIVGDTSASTSMAASGKIKINVTANGGDIYIPVYNATAASSGVMASATGDVASTTLTQTFNSNADNGTSELVPWLVKSGTTKWFEVSGNIDMCTILGQSHFDRLALDWIKWGTTVATAVTPANTWTWGLTDFKTSDIYLKICE